MRKTREITKREKGRRNMTDKEENVTKWKIRRWEEEEVKFTDEAVEK
jgi:hypothetical protein